MNGFLSQTFCVLILSAGLLLMTKSAQASSASDVRNWFSSAMGSHNLQGVNGENCNGVEIIDQGELMVLFPAQSSHPNGADAQLSFFDDESKMNINGNTYSAEFTLGIEGGTDQRESVKVVKNSDGSLQSLSIQTSTASIFNKKILLDMNCTQ